MTRSSRGFALPELLVASALSVLLAGTVLAVLHPSSAAFTRMPAVGDLQQRLRAASDLFASRLLGACASYPRGPRNPLGIEVPCLFPYGIGRMRERAPGAWHPAMLSVLAGAPATSAAPLATALRPSDSQAALEPGACPSSAPACGIHEGDSLLLIGPGGRWELVRAGTLQGTVIALQRPGPAAGASFPAGSLLVAADAAVFYLRDASGTDPPQLRVHDAALSDLPLLDHVVGLQIQFFGESAAPTVSADGEPSYGPRPPAAGVDDPDDSWGEGENCIFARAGEEVVPRLPDLEGSPLALVELVPAGLTDGPWCPDASSPSRFDADLLRIRRVRVSLRLEVAAAPLRGAGPFFLRPGMSRSGLALVPDREVAFDVVPRGLGGGR